MKRPLLGALLCSFVIALGLAVPLPAQWESWRGPEGTGTSRETDFPATWTKDGENLRWRREVRGRSTPVVHDGRVFTIGVSGEGQLLHERVVAFDARSGDTVWEDGFNVFHTTIAGPRVGWASPCVDPATGNVYVHGVQGFFRCYDRDGKLLWSRSLTEDNGRISGYGGRTNTPVVDGDLVILSFLNSGLGDQGRGAHRFMACDKLTGEIVWWSSPGGAPYDTTYSTPVVAVVDGVRVLICGAADGGVYALEVGTGRKVWGLRLSERGINVSPVVSGNRVYIAHSEENLGTILKGTVVCIDASADPDENGDITANGIVWRKDGLEVGYASPLLHDDILFVVDNSGNLIALDSQKGDELWRHSLGTVGKGSPVWVDGKIYVGEVNGRFHVLEPTREGCKTLSTVEFETPRGLVVEIFGSPAVANGRIYFTTSEATYCIGKENWSGSRGSIPPRPEAEPVSPDDPPATLLVRPAEVILEPGQSVDFGARLYNGRGQPLGEAGGDVAWTIQGLHGVIAADGKLTVPVVSRDHFGLVRATVNGLSGVARVRVALPPPFTETFDRFEPGKLPSGWLGMSPMKFRIVDLDGERVLMKHGERFELKFMRARAFIGSSGMSDYTIQADLRGSVSGRSYPEMGLINQRYELYMMGSRTPSRRKLRLISWVAERRVMQEAPFDWDEKIWYVAKLRVEPQGDQALVRAKVWKRGEPEPDAWSVSLEDPLPNREGSPGIYVFSAGATDSRPGADAYFDNVKVYPND